MKEGWHISIDSSYIWAHPIPCGISCIPHFLHNSYTRIHSCHSVISSEVGSTRRYHHYANRSHLCRCRFLKCCRRFELNRSICIDLRIILLVSGISIAEFQGWGSSFTGIWCTRLTLLCTQVCRCIGGSDRRIARFGFPYIGWIDQHRCYSQSVF